MRREFQACKRLRQLRRLRRKCTDQIATEGEATKLDATEYGIKEKQRRASGTGPGKERDVVAVCTYTVEEESSLAAVHAVGDVELVLVGSV